MVVCVVLVYYKSVAVIAQDAHFYSAAFTCKEVPINTGNIEILRARFIIQHAMLILLSSA